MARLTNPSSRLASDAVRMDVFLVDHTVRDPKLRHAYNARQHELRGTLAQALEARHAMTGVPLTYPAERLATAVLALSYGIAMDKLVDSEATPDELLGEILELLYEGLVHRAEAGAG